MTEPSSMLSDSDQAHDQDAPSKHAAPAVLLDDERPRSPLQKRPGGSPRQTGNLIPPPVNRLATSVPPSSPSSASSSSSPPRRVSTGPDVIDLCSDTEEESDDDNEIRDSHRDGRAPRSTGANPVAEERGGPMTSTTPAAGQETSRPMSSPVKTEQQAVDDDETEDEMELLDLEASGTGAAADPGTADGSELPTTAGASSGTGLSAADLPFPNGPETRAELHAQQPAPPALGPNTPPHNAARVSRPHVAEQAAAQVALSSSSSSSSTSPQEHPLARILETTQERMLITRPQPRRSPSNQLRRSQPSPAEALLHGLGVQAGPSGACGPVAQGPGGDRLEQDSTSGRNTPNLPLATFNSRPLAQLLAPPKRSKPPVTDSLGRLGAGTAPADSPTPQDKRPAVGGGGGATGPIAPLDPRSAAPKPSQRASLQCGPSPQHLAKEQRELVTHLLPPQPHQLGAQPLLLGESTLFPGLGTSVQASGSSSRTSLGHVLQQLPHPKLPTRVQPVGGPARVPSGPPVPAVATMHEYLKQHLRDLQARLQHHWPARCDLPLVFTLLEGTFKTAIEAEGSATSLDLVNTNVRAALEHLRGFLDEEPRKAAEERRRSIEGIVTKAGECGIKGFNVGNALDKLQKLRNSLRAYLTPQPGQEPLESESAKATKALEATKDAAKQARLLYDLAPPDAKWKFREGVDRVLKEVEKCSTALAVVEKKRKQLSFLQAVEPLVALLDSGSQQGQGGDVASLQADLLGVWDLWNQLRTAVLARAEGPGLSMLLVYDMRCGAHKVDLGHFECPERLDLAKTALNNLAQRHPKAYTLQPTLPPSCPYYPLYDPAFHTYRTEVLRVHREHYLERLRQLCERMDPGRIASLSKVEDQQDTMGCSKSFDAASVAFAATLEAVDAVMARRAHAAFVACRPPGHHAGRCGEPEDDESLGLGFCLLNYAAAAAKHARSQWQCARVTVIDIDLHHGNGTEEILCANHDHSYQFISIHADDMFPHTGARDPTREPFVVNLPIPGNVTSSIFKEKQRDVEAAVGEFRPDFIIVSAGFDAHKNDPIRDCENGYLVQRGHLTAADYHDFGVFVKRLATDLCLGRVVAILEGGYSVGCQGMGRSDGAVGGEQENLGHCVSALVRGMGMGGQTQA